jgi:hypothetical protein
VFRSTNVTLHYWSIKKYKGAEGAFPLAHIAFRLFMSDLYLPVDNVYKVQTYTSTAYNKFIAPRLGVTKAFDSKVPENVFHL